MKENIQNRLIAGSVSIAFHLLLLWGAALWALRSGVMGGKGAIAHVTLQASSAGAKAAETSEIQTQAQEGIIENPITAQIASVTTASPSPTVSSKATQNLPSSTAAASSSQANGSSPNQGQSETSVDARALYGSPDAAPSSALLELKGWMWDAIPQPEDTTTEIGKIVFEFTIDDLGEIIAVKTLEKTVSARVENIYRQALEKLSFSRTSEKVPYTSTATGKVTFFIRYR